VSIICSTGAANRYQETLSESKNEPFHLLSVNNTELSESLNHSETANFCTLSARTCSSWAARKMGCFQISQHHECMLTAMSAYSFNACLRRSAVLPMPTALEAAANGQEQNSTELPSPSATAQLCTGPAKIVRRVCALRPDFSQQVLTTYETTFCEMPLPLTIAVMQLGATTVRSAALRECRRRDPSPDWEADAVRREHRMSLQGFVREG
jgi:hypothetical protein